jgi:hypothetical protein
MWGHNESELREAANLLHPIPARRLRRLHLVYAESVPHFFRICITYDPEWFNAVFQWLPPVDDADGTLISLNTSAAGDFREPLGN